MAPTILAPRRRVLRAAALPRRSALSGLAALAALCLLGAPLRAVPPPGVLGDELQVNTLTAQIQQSSAVAIAANGDFVVAWQSEVVGHGDEIRARRFDARGIPRGDEVAVNTWTRGHQVAPAVAMGTDGAFVIVWQSLIASDFQIRARRFDAQGVALGNELAVSTTRGDAHGDAAVAMDAASNFVVAWETSFHGSYEIRARRFDARGVAQGDPIAVNSVSASSQRAPALAMAPNGDFVVVWRSNIQGSFEIRAQRFAAPALAQAGEIAVNAVTAGDQLAPTVAMDADGDFVVAWENSFEDHFEIRARRFTALGVPVAGESAVRAATAGSQFAPAIAMNAAGDHVIAWHDTAPGSSDVRAQTFSAAGAARGGELTVNAQSTGTQKSAAIAMNAAGQFVVSWHSDATGGWDVAARRGRISELLAR